MKSWIEVRATALHQLESLSKGGSTGLSRWRSTDSDPHFALIPVAVKDGQAFDAGWYMLEIGLHSQAELVATARLYVDYGEGYTEADALPLGHIATATGIAGVVCFMKRVVALRFDPMTEGGEFSLGTIRLRPISKSRAAWHMLSAIAERTGRWPDFMARLWRARAYPRSFGDWLYRTYRGAQTGGLSDYAGWIRQFDTHTSDELQAMAENVRRFADRPLISIVMPTYNSPQKWLIRCIESVQQQVYPHWELCVADDASSAPHVRKILQRYAKIDKRIKVVFREQNGHIAEASNTALELVGGEWIALMDHDDELPRHALYVVAKAINEHPEAGLIYSDEDKIDEAGHRFDPYFKPDWNYDLFLGQNMINHLGVYRAELVRKLGGFRKGMEGSQDYDLALRCIEQLKPNQIHHIPRVLYHWRAIAGSTAVSMDEKGYAAVAARLALHEHLERIGESEANVEVHRHGYRVRRRSTVAGRAPKVSLIVPTRDKVDLLRMCVESILACTSYPNYEIVVVDNQSSDPAALTYMAELGKRTRIRVLRYDEPFNYSAINNFAVRQCDGEIVGLVNNDIETIHADWLDEMVSQVVRPEIGAVGAMLYYPNDTIQHAGVVLGVGGIAAHVYCGAPRGSGGQMSRALLAQAMSVVTAACLLIRREVFEQVGGLDERLKVAFNDVDFCLRVREAGYTNLWTPYAELYHHESASRGYEDTPEKKHRFEGEVQFMFERWGKVLSEDPAYNPNLTLTGTPFDLAFPPRGA